MAFAEVHQLRRQPDRDLLGEDAVEYMEPCLLLLVQCHFLMGVRSVAGRLDATSRMSSLPVTTSATSFRHGLRVAVMKADAVPPERREAWGQRVEEGVDALVCHPRPVQTGLDLVEFPTICWYETDDSVYTMRQASRRSWRIGQTQPVQVVFMAYRNTLQADALQLVAKKLQSSLAVEGELPEAEDDAPERRGRRPRVRIRIHHALRVGARAGAGGAASRRMTPSREQEGRPSQHLRWPPPCRSMCAGLSSLKAAQRHSASEWRRG